MLLNYLYFSKNVPKNIYLKQNDGVSPLGRRKRETKPFTPFASKFLSLSKLSSIRPKHDVVQQHAPPAALRSLRLNPCRTEPMDDPGPSGEAERVPLQPNPSTAGPVSQVGRLGASVLHHQLFDRSDSGSGAERKARSHHRDLGPSESPGTPRDGEI